MDKKIASEPSKGQKCPHNVHFDTSELVRKNLEALSTGGQSILSLGSWAFVYCPRASPGLGLAAGDEAEEEGLFGHGLGAFGERSHLLLVERCEVARQGEVLFQLLDGVAADDDG